MKIKMKQDIAGKHGVHKYGAVVNYPDEGAKALIAAGAAVAVGKQEEEAKTQAQGDAKTQAPAPEQATANPDDAERAVKPQSRQRYGIAPARSSD